MELTPERVKKATAAMLRKWNAALEALRQAVQHPDVVRALVPYGVEFQASELAEIPAFDMPCRDPGMDARRRRVGRPHRHDNRRETPDDYGSSACRRHPLTLPREVTGI